MTRKIARARLLVTGVVTGAVVAAALTGCTAVEPPTGEAPAGESPSATAASSEEAPSADPAPVEGCTGALATDVPPIEVDVRVADGAVEPAPDRIDVPAGTTVVLRVEADAPAEVHVHGYDVAAEAAPGEPACLEVLADTPGVYDVEAHPETLLLQLAVR
ncbi:hypothetical protein C8K30_108197 [Promicromonospora sp. AC04]|uniref:hypothetical protein n=1 Tax=Promicromonospora sp. AC04 TaxID=2135723 RepID=UPI000D3801B9|nr:hypothetical protein [Promicromonospora sp. AC04]PUB24940.1 hypothetical protein C8K30_108197 [Promicromonospora sp. AC04]